MMTRASINSERLRKIVAAFAKTTVTVLGDMVADEFVLGEISRVSREAPVLILRHRQRDVVPGGGANAVNNLADLGVNVRPVGIVGNDDCGRLLVRSFRRKKIPTTAILTEMNRPTVTKTRILAGMPHTWRQQVVRIDREPESPLDRRVERQLARAARPLLSASNALLVSDYGYGAATPWLLAALRRHFSRNLPVVVDSRHRLLRFSGVTAATPNEAEVEEALGIHIGQDWRRLCAAGREILSRMHLTSLVITRGRDGMVAFERKRRPVDIPIFGSDQVTDVTGAGDTVIATFTAALGAGASAEEAAHLANYAGGIVVMKRGTATVSREELLAAIDEAPPRTRLH
ncbi:MAG: hypothetical protein JO159_16950 [Acidobacteria bacterium]|nr:hypothetical protein [Acidobacteriota bacterium]